MTLQARQLKATRAELEREAKRRDRVKLQKLREAIRAAKKARTVKMREVTAGCRAARRANMERAKRARQRLRESILRTRERAKTLCAVSRGDAQASTLREIERAVKALSTEQQLQGQLAAWTKPTSCAVPRGQRAREQRQESDCEVQANIEEPGLRVVWDAVKHKIRAGKRRSRTEAFYEWVAEHPADVYAIQERDAERALLELEKQERAMQRQLKQTNRYRKKSPDELRELLAGVPF